MKFGTIIADPPWPYRAVPKSPTAQGYSVEQYDSLSMPDLKALPIEQAADSPCVMLLWATWPFLAESLSCLAAWGFEFKTALPWIKATEIVPGTEPAFKPMYGVGYWLRGCSEVVLLGLRGKGSVRTNWIGLLSENAGHSRKPDTIYELAESFPGPHLELFARRERPGWVSLGNDPALLMAGDIRETLAIIGG